MAYHVLLALFFNFLISLVAHWLSVFVLVILDRRPCVNMSAIGSTSKSARTVLPKHTQRSLEEERKSRHVN